MRGGGGGERVGRSAELKISRDFTAPLRESACLCVISACLPHECQSLFSLGVASCMPGRGVKGLCVFASS